MDSHRPIISGIDHFRTWASEAMSFAATVVRNCDDIVLLASVLPQAFAAQSDFGTLELMRRACRRTDARRYPVHPLRRRASRNARTRSASSQTVAKVGINFSATKAAPACRWSSRQRRPRGILAPMTTGVPCSCRYPRDCSASSHRNIGSDESSDAIVNNQKRRFSSLPDDIPPPIDRKSILRGNPAGDPAFEFTVPIAVCRTRRFLGCATVHSGSGDVINEQYRINYPGLQ
jgi:hypothetical protein